MPTAEELHAAIITAGHRLLEAQGIELQLMNEKEDRPGLLNEVKLAGTAVDVLASEYLESIRRCRGVMAHDTSSDERLRKFWTPDLSATIQRPWRRRRSQSIGEIDSPSLR
jgi:hypothetical protein